MKAITKAKTPHPATVVQPKSELGRAGAPRPPHPATLGARALPPHPATKAAVQRMEESKSPFDKAVESGKSKYQEGAGEITESAALERATIFAKAYETDVQSEEKIVSSLTTEVKVEGNQYLNYCMGDGLFIADSNHHPYLKAEKALPASERTVKPLLTLSEVIFQQMRVMESKHGWKWNKVLKRSNVVNDETKIVFERLGWQSGKTYAPGDEGFYALLSTPNGVAAVFLLRDHGKDLGIRAIDRIQLKGGDGKNMFIYFK